MAKSSKPANKNKGHAQRTGAKPGKGLKPGKAAKR